MLPALKTKIPDSHQLRSNIWRYGVAVVSSLLAFVLAHLFVSVFGNSPDLFFLAAVVFSAWVGDFRGGLLATLLSGILLAFYFQPVVNSFTLTPISLIHIGMFMLIGILLTLLLQTRRSTETTLVQTNQQLDVILQGVADGITVQDRTGKVIYANYAAARFSGYLSVDAFLRSSEDYETRFDLYDEYGEPFPVNSLPGRLALTGMRVPEAVIRFVNRSTGEERWSNIKARPIFDAKGEITLAINLIHDITPFKTSERRLQQERNRFEVTLSSIGDAVIATDVQGRVTFLNRTAERLTGWTKERAYSKDSKLVFSIIDEHTREPAPSPVERVLENGTIIGLSNRTLLVSQDGTERPIDDSGAPIRDLDGNIIGVVIVFRDITELRKADAARRESENRFRIMADYAPVMIWMSGTDKLYYYFNKPWLEFTGRPLDDELGYGWTEGIHPEDRDSAVKLYDESFDRRESFMMDYRIRRWDGDYRWVANYGIPRFSSDGAFVGYIGSCIDITERKNVEQERTELLRREQLARAAAEEANELKLQFMAMISHELRTPLASIKGFASTLLAPDVDWDRTSQEQYIAIINEESDRLTALIEQLVDISRLQAGAMRINPEPAALAGIAERVSPQLRTISSVSQHRLVLEIPSDLPPVNVDELRVAQVLANLVDNAAKYSPPNTQIAVTAHLSGDYVQVDVTDQGEGIPLEDHGRVFEAFRQIHNRPSQKGAGLGLAISKGLIEAHGGRIWIQERSTPGTTPGTTVSFTVPVAKVGEAEAEPSVS